MMSIDETLMCSFQILKPADKKKTIGGGFGFGPGAAEGRRGPPGDEMPPK